MPLIRKPVLGLVEEVLLDLYSANYPQLERLLEKYGFGVVWGCHESDPEFEFISSVEFEDCDWTDPGVVQRLLEAVAEAVLVHQTQPGYAKAEKARVSHLLGIMKDEGYEWTGSGFDWSMSKSFASSVNGLIRLQEQKFALESPRFKVDLPRPAAGGGEVKVNGQGAVQRAQAKVFIVHGHDELARQSVARFVENLGLETIILGEKPTQGKTLIEKLERFGSEAAYAIVLLTPDDVGYAKSRPKAEQKRARQNVVFELGYFVARLGRDKVCLLYKAGVEIPSDLAGVGYEELDDHEGWHKKLARALDDAGLPIDAKRLLK